MSTRRSPDFRREFLAQTAHNLSQEMLDLLSLASEAETLDELQQVRETTRRAWYALTAVADEVAKRSDRMTMSEVA
jgi:hypothetical protein